MRVLVLDTSAFIVGFNPLSSKFPVYVVPEVADELSLSVMSKTRFEMALELQRLIVQSPTDESCKIVAQESRSIGEECILSQTDLKILALALDMRNQGADPVIVSDDYAIQNVAERLGLSYTSLITFGISYEFNWILYCPACFRKFPHDYSAGCCRVCGTSLKRKVLRKRRVKRKLVKIRRRLQDVVRTRCSEKRPKS